MKALKFCAILKIGAVFLLSMLLIACGDPVQLSMNSYEEQLDSAVETDDKLRAPKYQRKRVPLVRRPISDIVKEEVTSATPPPPAPPASTPKKDGPPTYVRALEEKTTKPSGAKIRVRPTPEREALPKRASSGKVDIVVVVDVSQSMKPFLRSQRVKQAFGGFAQALWPLDWQMMFTNADYGDRWFLANTHARDGKAMNLEHNGKRLPIKALTKHTPHYSSIFIDTLRHHEHMEYTTPAGDSDNEISQCRLAPGCHSMTFNEQPLKSTQASFVNNRSFFRPGADVAVIIFSDSDEGEEHKDISKRTKAGDVLKTFEEQWGIDNKRLMAYGIIMIPGEDSECVKKYSSGSYLGEGLFGTELARMAELTGGENYSLCDENYVSLAKQMVVDFQE